MKNRPLLWIVLIIVVALVLICGGCMALGLLTAGISGSTSASARGVGDAIAIIEVKGIIVSGPSPRGFGRGIAYAERIIQDLDKALADPTVKAIVLDINSPGGGVVPSTDIYRALKECDKPIVASMGELAASGGYYVSCASQHIVVRPATLTGSIGVIAQFTNAQELMRKLGIEQQTIKTGKHKDQGGLHRPLEKEEMLLYQTIVDETLEEFVRVIIEGRNLPEQRVRRLADGRVFSGRQAVALGLADTEGNLDDAIKKAAELGSIEGEPRIVRFEQEPTFFDLLGLLLEHAGRPTEIVLLEELVGNGEVPRLQYLYTGP